jgi:hypothetical protein
MQISGKYGLVPYTDNLIEEPNISTLLKIQRVWDGSKVILIGESVMSNGNIQDVQCIEVCGDETPQDLEDINSSSRGWGRYRKLLDTNGRKFWCKPIASERYPLGHLKVWRDFLDASEENRRGIAAIFTSV